MAAPIRPASAKAFTREKWVFVTAISAQAAPTATEVTAGTVLDISCYLFDTSASPTQNTNLVEKIRRICDGAIYQQIGTTTYTGGEILYALQPQAVAASDGKKAWEKFPSGTTGFLVRRLDVAVATDLAAGQFVDVFPVEFGPQMPVKVGDGEAAEVGVTQTFAITGPPNFVVAIAS